MTLDTQIINSTGKTIISVNVSDNSLVIATIVLAFVTAILAILTGLYFKETRLLRKISQSPSFSLEPSLYELGGSFHALNIVNSGTIGKNIEIDCMWKKNGETASNLKRFYVLSLSPHGRTSLDQVPIGQIVSEHQFLSVTIKCQDSRGEEYVEKLEKDFSTLTANGREIGFQSNANASLKHSLGDISNKLNDIANKLSDIAHKIK